MWAKTNKTGFTIVELLIVIVVIAVLASITVTAYGGITKRSSDTQIVTIAKSYERMLLLYKADNGVYPQGHNWVCMGAPGDFPAQGVFLNNECVSGSSPNVWSATLHTQLSPYASSFPKGIHKAIDDTYGGKQRGVVFDTFGSPANGASINYNQEGNVPCPYGIKRPDFINHPTSTFCYIDLPD